MLTHLPPALAALAPFAQFVVYKLVPSTAKPGKTDKLPVDWRTGQLPSSGMGGSAIWTTFANASAAAAMFGSAYGAGFSLAASDPFWFLDIDNCLQSDNTWSPIALELCAALAGCAVEVSQSGRGLHLIGTGTVPDHGCKNILLGLEFYTADRFVALTGTGATGDASHDATAALAEVVAKYFPARAPTGAAPASIGDGPVPEWKGPTDDDDLIRRMLASKPSSASAFGGKATVVDLWEGNVEALARSYPASGDGEYDASGADLALMMHLAFWTGKDAERMLRLAQRSALKRDKWEREDYLVERTIPAACASTNNVYRETPPDMAAPSNEASGRQANGLTILSPENQLELWKGCTYVTDANVILTASGQQLGPEQFKNLYGGYSFVMSRDNGKMSDNAWQAFTHSQAMRMPKVDHCAFRPELEPGAIWTHDGESFVNTYRRINVPRKAGDATPLLNHMRLVLPDAGDDTLLLSYMAAIVQMQGIKFQWCPFIQGVEGNGKSLFSRCVAEAVGQRYTHWPRVSELTGTFNSWIVNKIFIGVEDVFYPEGRTEILETLKPMITNSTQPIRAMRQAERTMDICANFIVNSNHKDAIRKTAKDRRWAMMFCAQQSLDDLVRDGMNKAYFQKLYGWLNADGYAIVTDLLNTYPITDEFKQSLLSRAPITSSTDEAIAVGLGRVEQEIMECIESGSPGFAGGWVSSLALDRMLKDHRMDAMLPRCRRLETMQALGYDHHPALRGGRSTVVVPNTTERPVLFIKAGHWAATLQTGQEIMAAYTAAQMPGAQPIVGIATKSRSI